MKAEQREETIPHAKANIQALPMIYQQFLTAVWSGTNSPDHPAAVPELGAPAGHAARTKLSQGKEGMAAEPSCTAQGSSEPLQLLHPQPGPTATQGCGSGGFPCWVPGFAVWFCFLNPIHTNLRSCLLMTWLPKPFPSVQKGTFKTSAKDTSCHLPVFLQSTGGCLHTLRELLY